MAAQFEIEIALEEPGHAAPLIDLGVHRIELCSNLVEGGLTPSSAQVGMVADISDLPVYAMLRPRSGNFTYNRIEKHMMLEELKVLSDCGATGIVFGALDADGYLDRDFVELVAQFCTDFHLQMTFHRAFDACQNPHNALDFLVDLGVERILTSGFQPTAPQGLEELRDLVAHADNRISIQAGSGVSAAHADALWEAGIRSFHMTARKAVRGSAGTAEDRLGFNTHWELDEEKVTALNAALWAKM